MAFQSPSRWGRCCIALASWMEGAHRVNVSVPFSMGTVLHREIWREYVVTSMLFQSPSRWGRCCILANVGSRILLPNVSVPFSMGTVLHLAEFAAQHSSVQDVSVPFSMGTVLHLVSQPSVGRYSLCFSPLLDGDGVASSR